MMESLIGIDDLVLSREPLVMPLERHSNNTFSYLGEAETDCWLISGWRLKMEVAGRRRKPGTRVY